MLSFGVSLIDKITAPANKAGAAADKLAKQMTHLSNAQKQLALAKSIGDVAGYKKFSAMVADGQKSVFNLRNEVMEAGPAAEGLGTALAGVAGPALAVAAAVGGVIIGLGALTVAGAALALEQSALEGRLRATFSALAGGPEAGKKTLAMLDTMAEKLPQSREQLAGWTKSYMAMGMTDIGQLKTTLTATASAAAIMGDDGAAAFEKLTKKIQVASQTGSGLKIPLKGLGSLADMGLRVDDVAAKMGISSKVLAAQLKAGSVNAKTFGEALNSALIEKGAGPLATMGAELGVQWTKFKETLTAMFKDVDAKPFLEQVRSLLGVFKESKPSGKAMKTVITETFTGLFKTVATGGPKLKHFFLDLIIYAGMVRIGLKPVLRDFSKWSGSFDSMAKGAKVVATVLGVLGAVAAVVGAGAVGVFGSMIGGVLSAIGGLSSLAGRAWDALVGFITMSRKAADDFLSGLVNGIVDGIPKVIAAAKNMGKSAIDAVKGIFKSASPSKAMFALGVTAPQGLAGGITDGTDEVHRAASDMGGTAMQGAKGGLSGGGSKGGAVTVNVGGITINGAGKDANEITEEAVSLVFERVALAQAAF